MERSPNPVERKCQSSPLSLPSNDIVFWDTVSNTRCSYLAADESFATVVAKSNPNCKHCAARREAITTLEPEPESRIFSWFSHDITDRKHGHILLVRDPKYVLPKTIQLFTISSDFEKNLFCVGSEDRDPFMMRKPSLDTSSEQSLQFAKSCIRKCTQDHPDCGDGSEEPLPTRILCIGTVENPTVYLRDTATESSRYVCLSHCWGNRAQDSTMLQATTENILEFKKNIPWSELPKTFRDAICFVRLLGIGYIWIDSMCIIQDDPADCAREVGQMASIYSNAFLTIAATSASGPHEGLFSTTTQTSVAQILPGGALNAEFSGYGPVYAHPKIHHTWEEPVNFPLLKRGWVLQERMLSRRVLHFTKKELMWECLSASGCECRSASHVGHRHKKDFISIERIRSQLSDWGDIVRVYSSLRLTLDADTLPALSGLASVWKNAFQDRYLAGLWRHRLLYGLLWMRISPVSRPKEYQAPSWSWASCAISEPVYFTTKMEGDQNLAKIVEVECTPKDNADPTGKVSSGYLKLAANSAHAKLNLAYDKSTGRKIIYVRGRPVKFWQDCSPEIEGLEVEVAALASRRRPAGVNLRFLVLSLNQGLPKTYRRIGYGELHLETSHWSAFGKSPEQEEIWYWTSRGGEGWQEFTII